MDRYNLYYKGTRINRYPISQVELDKISEINKPINKVIGERIEEIPLNKIRVVKCIIV